jgi:hypothetical protein
VTNAFKQVVPGGVPLASDLNQLIWALTGQADVGQISLFSPLTAPSAPTVTASQTAGVLNGSYKYVQVFVTGWIGNDGSYYVSGFAPSAASSPISLTNQQATVTLATGPSGTIARILYRTVAGGSAYNFLTFIGDNTTTSYTDNIADSSLGTGMPTSTSVPSVNGTAIPATAPTNNTTGTTLSLSSLTVTGGTHILTDGDASTRSFVQAFQNTAQTFPANSWTTLVCQTKAYDNKGEYSTSAGGFTASKAGLYIFNAGVYLTGFVPAMYTAWYVNGTIMRRGTSQDNVQGTANTMIVRLNAGDYVEYKVQPTGTLNTTGSSDGNFFHSIQVG